MNWTTPAELEAQVQRLWDSGRLLRDIADGLSGVATPEAEGITFPLKLRLRGPAPRELATRHDEARTWILALEDGSRTSLGYGYDIVWSETTNRLIGRNRTPRSIEVPTRADALALIGKVEEASHFVSAAQGILDMFPELEPWIARKPLAVLNESVAWPQILSVLAWLRANPRSGRYLREIDAPGVDTKFIEARKTLLAELLDFVLPADAIDRSRSGAAEFEARYGLATKPALVRLRILDADLAIQGLTDLTVRVDELARLDLGAERVLIVENEITGLAMPAISRTSVIFGLGYAVDLLANVPWLRSRDMVYWGDIDTHGFRILDRLRSILPHARSVLMDRETLHEHQAHWTTEPAPTIAPLDHLTPTEASLYDDLRYDRLGRAVRLEQERIPLREALAVLAQPR